MTFVCAIAVICGNVKGNPLRFQPACLIGWPLVGSQFDHLVEGKRYQCNPELSVQRKVDGEEIWLPIYQALGLPFVNEFALDFVWTRIDEYLMQAGLPETTQIKPM